MLDRDYSWVKGGTEILLPFRQLLFQYQNMWYSPTQVSQSWFDQTKGLPNEISEIKFNRFNSTSTGMSVTQMSLSRHQNDKSRNLGHILTWEPESHWVFGTGKNSRRYCLLFITESSRWEALLSSSHDTGRLVTDLTVGTVSWVVFPYR